MVFGAFAANSQCHVVRHHNIVIKQSSTVLLNVHAPSIAEDYVDAGRDRYDTWSFGARY